MKYKCTTCNYETNDKSNFNKHINSVAHIQLTQSINTINTKINTNVNTNVNQELPSNFLCLICNKTFSSAPSLSRHKNHYCKNQNNNQTDKDKQIELLKQQLIEYQQAMKDKEIEYLKKEVNELKSFIRSGKYGNTTNYNISIKKYVQQHYSDAPALEGVKDYAKLTYDETDFIETIISKFNNDVLHKYLGDFIIQYYKKDNPSEQSIWNSDVSRLTYVIKELLENNQSIWNHDYKGVKTKNYVITPLLKYIRKSIDKYWMDNIDTFKVLETRELVQLQENLIILQKVKRVIDNESLADEIVRYIAPEFYMNKTNKNELDINKIEHFIDNNEEIINQQF
ncbi:zinc finger protein C2H2-type protein [Fadolivirus algeromassiliense]|jgi:anti-sigma28 factor (negative regulator of flagellin synthesis)|uniref:Zinc finger protein C2H2-type protein n=1 Tax=Fadolivirus FV1/VV64 TaxID=3070911 RepID=A0A7D3UUU6_9VIRU|nr:zinc finger protein C2H2-type protein [Fadolivirus algeromassiliense]QKF93729.1 zinc finger protein C2H2-type protein [Fadolivirus FV1/VV64]